MTLTAGIDTYITLAEADAYFATTLNNSAWDALSDATKEITIKSATRKLETLIYTGVKQVDTQALEFPRYYGNSHYDGTPTEVKNACAEIALSLYNNQNNKALEAQALGISSMSLGNESYSFDTASSASSIINQDASSYLNKWTAKGVKIA